MLAIDCEHAGFIYENKFRMKILFLNLLYKCMGNGDSMVNTHNDIYTWYIHT